MTEEPDFTGSSLRPGGRGLMAGIEEIPACPEEDGGRRDMDAC